MKIFKKVTICVALIICFVLWWRVGFCNEKPIYSETDISSDKKSFIAEFDTINSIAVTNEDASIADRLLNQKCNLSVTIYDNEGDIVSERKFNKMKIPTNEYSSMKDSDISNTPIKIELGEEYNISYECIMEDGTKAKDLSFIFYSYAHSSNHNTFFLFMILLIITLITTINIGVKRFITSRYLLVWLLTVVITVFLMPTINSARERSAFADTYAISNSIMGERESDENGYTYINENGIRNMGNISDNLMLFRFWKDNSDGYARENGKVSLNYKCNETRKNLLMYPAAFAITLVRLLDKSDRLVMCAGWAVNAIIVLVILAFCQLLVSKQEEILSLIRVMFLMPSIIIESMSYTGFGIVIALCTLVALLVVCIAEKEKKHRYFIPLIGTISILIIYAVQNLFDVSLNGCTIGEFICSGVNTILARFDELLCEFTLHDYSEDSKMFISAYIFIVMILILKYQYDRHISTISFDRLNVKPSKYIMLIFIYYFMTTLMEKCIVSGGKYEIFNISGVVFIPILLIPCRIKGRIGDYIESITEHHSQYNDIMISVAAITSCIVELIRYEAL